MSPSVMSADELRVACMIAGRTPPPWLDPDLAEADRTVADVTAGRALIARGFGLVCGDLLALAPGTRRSLAPLLFGDVVIEVVLGERRHLAAEGDAVAPLLLSEREPDIWAVQATGAGTAAGVVLSLLDEVGDRVPSSGMVRVVRRLAGDAVELGEVEWMGVEGGFRVGADEGADAVVVGASDLRDVIRGVLHVGPEAEDR